MKSSNGKSSRELGLKVAAICGKHFFDLDHLHYGYWTSDLPVDISNFRIAQEKYTDLLVSHVPDEVKTVLDVGCGTGQIAKKMIDMGYQVDCVSPSPYLTERTRSILTNGSRIFECPYEQMDIEHKYDMVLFSESFQYVNMSAAFEKTINLLNPNGYLLICDFFKIIKGPSTVGGGHKLRRFNELVAAYPFELIEDKDITKQTAPNIDLFNDTMQNVVAPVLNESLTFLSERYPLTVKFVKWKFRKKLSRISNKYFNGQRSGNEFIRSKTYRLFLYRKQISSNLFLTSPQK